MTTEQQSILELYAQTYAEDAAESEACRQWRVTLKGGHHMGVLATHEAMLPHQMHEVRAAAYYLHLSSTRSQKALFA
jgi:hypothetical protein